MNKFLIYGVGFIMGAGTGFLVTKKILAAKYAAIAQDEIDDMKEFLIKRATRVEDVQLPDLEKTGPETTFRHGPPTLVRSSIIDNPYEAVKKDYNIISDKGTVHQFEVELPVPIIVDDPDAIDTDKPYIIDDVRYSEECDHFAKIDLFYYLDGVLCESDETFVDDISGTIGDQAFEYLQHGAKELWVRNELLGADYEILALHQAYEDIQAGLEVTKTRRRKFDEEQ